MVVVPRLADWSAPLQIITLCRTRKREGRMAVFSLLVAPLVAASSKGESQMEAIIERCCGLDVHKDVVVACVLIGPADGKARKEIRTYGTTTAQLEQLRDWLHQVGCTHVGMESTGVYWVPVYAVLEDHFELIVGNAGHMKNVPGRKTDVKDAQWIAELIPLWSRPQELCTAEVATCAARSDAVPTQAGRSPGERTQSAAASIGDLQREAGVSGHRRVR